MVRGQEVPNIADRPVAEALGRAEMAFNAGDWNEAADGLRAFLVDYGGLQEMEDTVKRVRPLLAISLAKMGRHEEAGPLLNQILESGVSNQPLKTDLLFFAGIAALQTREFDLARGHFGAIFVDLKVPVDRRMEALILGGSIYMQEERWEEAVQFLERHQKELAAHSAEVGSRALILQLLATMKLQKWIEAAGIAKLIYQNLSETRQIVAYSSQLISLGSELVAIGEYHEAILVLRMVPAEARLRLMQQDRIAAARLEMGIALANGDQVKASQLSIALEGMERELAAFLGVKQFDSGSRLRLAGAYFELGRVREACLILDQMIRQMEPNETSEAATASLIRGWMSLERYKRAVRTADLYFERMASLDERPNLADVMFLRAQALEGQSFHQEAAYSYREVAERFPGEEISIQASFMEAYNILQLEDYEQAGALFDESLEQLNPQEPMWAHSIHWRAMTYYFDQQWESARDLFEKYLDAAGGDSSISSEYVDDAHFRIAYSIFSEANYEQSIPLLEKFTIDYPESEWLAEALLSLGDAYSAEGELNKALGSYRKIGIEAPGFHDEGWMKIGNIYKVQKDFIRMQKHFKDFVEQRSDSPRIAEGMQWLGWIAKHENNLEGARKIYFETIRRYGDDRVRPGLEEIFIGLQSLYQGEELKDLEKWLVEKKLQAVEAKQTRLMTRLSWARAQLHLVMKLKSDDPRMIDSQRDLISLASDIEAKETAPRILIDLASVLSEAGLHDQAFRMYEELRRWWPRSPLRDQAFAGMAFIEMRRGNIEAALLNFEKFEKFALMPKTAPDLQGIVLVEGEVGGKVAMSKAQLLSKKMPLQALNIYLAVQRTRSMPANLRADALLAAGAIHVQTERYREALPYYEQVYLLFHRYPEKVATAYWERGRALELMGEKKKAREVYSELASREDLKDFKVTATATRRAEDLGGVLAPMDLSIGTRAPLDAKETKDVTR